MRLLVCTCVVLARFGRAVLAAALLFACDRTARFAEASVSSGSKVSSPLAGVVASEPPGLYSSTVEFRSLASRSLPAEIQEVPNSRPLSPTLLATNSTRTPPRSLPWSWDDVGNYLACGHIPAAFQAVRFERIEFQVGRLYKFMSKRAVRRPSVYKHCSPSDLAPLKIWQGHVTAWASEHVAMQGNNSVGAEPLPLQVLYPFGGSDVFSATSLFPGAKEYTLVGLVDAGSSEYLANFRANKTLRQASFVATFPLNLIHFVKTTYFQTRSMELSAKLGIPMVATLLASLSAMDVKILGVTQPPLGSAFRSGVRISCVSASGRRFVVQYLQGDLSKLVVLNALEKLLATDQGRGPSLSKKPFVALLKDTHYFPHHKQFRRLSNFVASKASLIVQTDSGIPYSQLVAQSDLKLQLHGGYPLHMNGDGDMRPSYRSVPQPDLAEAYQHRPQGHNESLPFRFGYCHEDWRRRSDGHWESLSKPVLCPIIVARRDVLR